MSVFNQGNYSIESANTTEGFLAASSAEPQALEPSVEGSRTDNATSALENSIAVDPRSDNFSPIASTSTYKEVFPKRSNVEKDFYPQFEGDIKRRRKESIPFLLKMVDRNLRVSGIKVSDAVSSPELYLITGIRFSPNPSNLSINSAKLINRYNTMTRWVEEHWGDEVDSIMFSGSTFSFLGYGLEGNGNVGLTVRDRGLTRPYSMVKEMVRFFKTNGMIYQDNKNFDGMGVSGSATQRFLEKDFNYEFKEDHPLTGVPKERLYVNLYFDYVSFLGHFESFDIIEDSTNPYRFTYNCVFKAERTVYHQGNTALG